MPTVTVSQYNSAWPEAYSAIQRELEAVFAPGSVAVEHIGSTAVPGLAAKPVIDVLLGVDSLCKVEHRVEALASLGYEYRPSYELQIPERRYFVKAPAGDLRVHVHAVVACSHLWSSHLAFRNALRASRKLREEYQDLKLRLASEHPTDKALYTAAKSPFIERVLAEHLRDVG